MPSQPHFCLLLVTDRDQALAQPGQVTEIEGDVEVAWLPVRCEACGEIALVAGEQRGVADRDMTATAHRGQCEACGQAIEGRVDWLQERYRAWQPLANDNLTGGEPVFVDDLAERVP